MALGADNAGLNGSANVPRFAPPNISLRHSAQHRRLLASGSLLGIQRQRSTGSGRCGTQPATNTTTTLPCTLPSSIWRRAWGTFSSGIRCATRGCSTPFAAQPPRPDRRQFHRRQHPASRQHGRCRSPRHRRVRAHLRFVGATAPWQFSRAWSAESHRPDESRPGA